MNTGRASCPSGSASFSIRATLELLANEIATRVSSLRFRPSRVGAFEPLARNAPILFSSGENRRKNFFDMSVSCSFLERSSFDEGWSAIARA